MTRPHLMTFLATQIVTVAFTVLTVYLLLDSRVDAQESGGRRQVVTAHMFHVINDDGQIRATLGLMDHRPSLVLFDERGQVRAQLLIMATGQPGIILSDPQGIPRVHVVLLPDNAPTVTLSDERHQPRAALVLLPDGRPSVSLMGPQGQLQAQLSVNKDQRAMLDLQETASRETEERNNSGTDMKR